MNIDKETIIKLLKNEKYHPMSARTTDVEFEVSKHFNDVIENLILKIENLYDKNKKSSICEISS